MDNLKKGARSQKKLFQYLPTLFYSSWDPSFQSSFSSFFEEKFFCQYTRYSIWKNGDKILSLSEKNISENYIYFYLRIETFFMCPRDYLLRVEKNEDISSTIILEQIDVELMNKSSPHVSTTKRAKSVIISLYGISSFAFTKILGYKYSSRITTRKFIYLCLEMKTE